MVEIMVDYIAVLEIKFLKSFLYSSQAFIIKPYTFGVHTFFISDTSKVIIPILNLFYRFNFLSSISIALITASLFVVGYVPSIISQSNITS